MPRLHLNKHHHEGIFMIPIDHYFELDEPSYRKPIYEITTFFFLTLIYDLQRPILISLHVRSKIKP